MHGKSHSGKIFQGLVFVFAGVQCYPVDELKKMIEDNGGIIFKEITEQVNYVLSSFEMASVWGNDFKIQFFENFKSIFTEATFYSIPIVSGHFIQASIDAGMLVNDESFFIFEKPNQISTQSKLDPRVQDLISLIFDKSAQQQTILELNLDSSRFESISENNITSAFELLSELEKSVQLKSIKRNQQESQKKLEELSKKFYTLIPHTKTITIETDSIIKEKISMLEALKDILIANKFMKNNRTGSYSVSPIDINYKKLKTSITPLEKWTKEYDVIENYVKNSQAAIHNWFTIDLEEVFVIEREGEKENFKSFENLKHHRLLFHGSRISNYVGILSQGLRIAPKEAPVTGYFLGKGVYFADMVSKSAEYCRPPKENPYALMMLCEVALGRPFQVAHTKFISKEDLDLAKYHSVKGCGELGPNPAFDIEMMNGTIVSLGKETSTGVLRSELKHNEYVVYDVRQIIIRYLLKLKIVSQTGKDIKANLLLNAN